MSKSSLVNVNVPAYEGNYTKGRSGRKIEAITIHHMAGRLTAEQCGKIFQAVGRYGSSHYGIGYDGRIGQYVDEADTAWTNSNWDSNCKSVTIETSDNDNSWYVNDTTLNSLIKLVADIAKRNNLGTLVTGKNLTWHSMFTNTSCPGDYLRSKMQYIADEANKINSGSSVPSSNDVNVYYKAKTLKHGWLPEVKNLEDYAGWENSPITGLAIRVDKGSIKYRVTTVSGKQLGWITGYNINDYIKGWAGNGEAIALVEVYYYTPNDIRPYKKAKYKVNNYDWQYDNEKTNGQDGFAGVIGVPATKFQIVIE
ncbi:MAG: N-acetylmuramoyl-L-alanine amidase [Clostridia bacterium]